MTLNLSSFEKALLTLREAVVVYDKDRQNDFMRDACIQRFEYSYEIAGKMLKRYLEMTEGSSAAVDAMAFPDLIRTGCERGLLASGWDRWRIFREARNITSHTYDAIKAARVYAVIPEFLLEAEALLAALKKGNETL